MVASLRMVVVEIGARIEPNRVWWFVKRCMGILQIEPVLPYLSRGVKDVSLPPADPGCDEVLAPRLRGLTPLLEFDDHSSRGFRGVRPTDHAVEAL